MAKFIAIISALWLLTLTLPAPALAAEPDSGVIEGVVVNETNGSVEVPNQEIILKVYLNNSETSSKTAKTDDKGRFIFEALSTKSGYGYEATLNYQEAEYASQRVGFAGGVTRQAVRIAVYDSTTSAEVIKVQTAHTVIFAEEGNLLVKKYAQFDNATKLTYTGSKEIAPGKKETLRFFLPDGATEVEYGLDLMQCCVYPSGDNVISDTMAFLPGAKEVTYAYKVPYKADEYTFIEKFDYPTGRFNLLVQGSGISVTGNGLTREAPVNIQGQTFDHFSAEAAGAGQTLEIKLSGLPQNRGQRSVIIIALVAAVFVLGLGYLILRRKPRPAPVRAGGTPSREKQRLLLEIARLDDDFETGGLDEDTYHRQRAVKKRQLLRLMRQ